MINRILRCAALLLIVNSSPAQEIIFSVRAGSSLVAKSDALPDAPKVDPHSGGLSLQVTHRMLLWSRRTRNRPSACWELCQTFAR